MPKRTSVKAWKSRKSHSGGKSARIRRRPYKPMALTTSGMKTGLGSAPFKHKFTRLAATVDFVSNGSGIINTPQDSGGVSCPVSVGPLAADFSGVPTLWQTGASWQFKITDCPSYNDYKALFDQYQIQQVDFEVSNVHNNAEASTNISVMPTLYYAPDYDDANVPTAANMLTERQRVQQWTFRGDGQPLRFSIKPRVLNNVYRDGVSSAYQVAPPAFLDMANDDVPHYGVKMWFENLYAQPSGGPKGETHLRFKLKYHFAFKDPQ